MQSSATVFSMTRTKSYYSDITEFFFKRVDKIESIKEPEPVPLASDVSDTAACPSSPIADNPSALPSPTSSLPLSNSCLFTRCQLLYASCCTGLLYFSRHCTVRFKIFSLFFVFVFLCIISVRSIINLLQYSVTWPTMSVGT